MKKEPSAVAVTVRKFGRAFVLWFVIGALLASAAGALYLYVPRWLTPREYPRTILYSLFGEEKSVKSAELLRDGVFCLDFGKIASGCGLSVSGDAKTLTFLSADGKDGLTVTDGSDLVYVNGSAVHLGTPVSVRGSGASLPLSFITEVASGLNVTWNEDKTELKVERVREDGKPVPLTFVYQKTSELIKISPDGIPVEISVDPSELEYEFINDFSSVRKYLNPEDDGTLLLLYCPSSPAGADDKPSGLRDIRNLRKGTAYKYQLYTAAEYALEAMLTEMASAGFTDMYATRGYVGYDDQKKNYDNYVWNERFYYRYNFETTGKYFSDAAYEVLGQKYIDTVYLKPGTYALTQEDAASVVVTYCAAPGTSDHQTGLGVDIHNQKKASAEFAQTEQYRWLRENAYKFGFIERYPEGAERMTGFSYEPYHWRFVGQYHAAVMHRENYCLEEYIAALGLQ